MGDGTPNVRLPDKFRLARERVSEVKFNCKSATLRTGHSLCMYSTYSTWEWKA